MGGKGSKSRYQLVLCTWKISDSAYKILGVMENDLQILEDLIISSLDSLEDIEHNILEEKPAAKSYLPFSPGSCFEGTPICLL